MIMKNINVVIRIFCLAAAVLLFAGCGKPEAEQFYEKARKAQSESEKLAWYVKAAEKGHAGAQVEAGTIYLALGTDISLRDLVQAEKWLKKAAQSSDKYAKERAEINLDTLATMKKRIELERKLGF